jgi:hypothetical protein
MFSKGLHPDNPISGISQCCPAKRMTRIHLAVVSETDQRCMVML